MQSKKQLSVSILIVLLVALTIYGTSSVYSMQGKVLSPKGEPLGNAILRINYDNLYMTKTDTTGSFEWNDKRYPAFAIEAWQSTLPGYKSIWLITLHPEPVAMLTLKKTVELQGMVSELNDKSKPIKKAKIFLESDNKGYSSSGFSKITTIATDSEGRYLIKDLVPDQTYRLIIYADNYVRIISKPFKATLDQQTSIPPEITWIQLEPGYRIPIIITTDDNKPIPGAHIITGGKDWAYCDMAITDMAGKAILSNLPLKEAQLDVFYAGTRAGGGNYSITDLNETIRIQLSIHGDDLLKKDHKKAILATD